MIRQRVSSYIKIEVFSENIGPGRKKRMRREREREMRAKAGALLSLSFPCYRHESFCPASIFYLDISFSFAVVTAATKKRTQHEQ